VKDKFLDLLKDRVLVFDGATGTNLQAQNLTADDFGGEQYNGCNEYLVVSKPSAVEKLHIDFLEAGCDVIETDTFGGTAIVLGEYGLQDKVYELNRKAAEIAKRIASDYSTSDHPRFVAGSVGPTTKLPSLGHISFKDMKQAYYNQVRGLVDGGVDLLSVETCQDLLQMKAALAAIYEYFADTKKKLPVIASVTIGTTGTMLMGTEIAAALTTLEPYDIVDAIGMNCATGPKEMSEHVRYLCANSPKPVFVMPNAGLPENIGGKACYRLSPEELAQYLLHFVKDFGVNIVGGCCGTTAEHIRQLVQALAGLSPLLRHVEYTSSVASLYSSVPLSIDNPPVIVGERTNANGSKKFRELLQAEDWEGIVTMGKEQVKEGAHILDVCVAYVGRDEVQDMHEVIKRFNTQVTIPLMIDSTEWQAIEEALQNIAGRAIVNSINMEDGEERMSKVLLICKKYGAAVIALTIDEQGMAKTASRKFEVAQRIHEIATKKYGMREEDLIFDTLTFTLGSGDEEFRRAGIETLEAIRLIKQAFPKCKTLLGVSNVSFGLAPHIRNILNSVFLRYAIEYGLDMAIVNAQKIMPLYKIDERGRELCRQLIFDKRKFDDGRCVYDPLTELMAYYAAKKVEKQEKRREKVGTVEEVLRNRIVDGDKIGLEDDLKQAMEKYKPLDIINNILLDGMRVVSDLFGSGQMQLPFVLQSAEVMKAAVSYLEPYMEKTGGTTAKGTMVIATVKGDVHDIGKNLVDIILTNNGYKVIDLGIKCPIETMIHAAEEQKADAIGMSGLLVKSTVVMKENLEVMNEQGITIPVILGGAALTRRYVEQDLRSIYKGQVFYAGDAFDGLHLMEQIVSSNIEFKIASGENVLEEDYLTAQEAKIAAAQVAGSGVEKLAGSEAKTLEQQPKKAVPIPVPPFYGVRYVEDISLDEVFPYINEVALFRGQWAFRRGKIVQSEYKQMVEEKVRPILENLKLKAKSEKLLTPKVVYGYFPCQSDGNDLIIYKPNDEPDLYSEWHGLKPESIIRNSQSPGSNSTLIEWLRFTFPRQSDGKRLCISDFFVSRNSPEGQAGVMDVVAFHLVTVGKQASEYARKLFESNKYADYLYFHGLSVETAEALAEYWHKKIREELSIVDNDAKEIKRLFAQGYRGARYSFGYPACPNLEDQAKLFELLRPERIGVTLTEEYQLVPEQSTSAIIVHHPEARYFNIK